MAWAREGLSLGFVGEVGKTEMQLAEKVDVALIAVRVGGQLVVGGAAPRHPCSRCPGAQRADFPGRDSEEPIDSTPKAWQVVASTVAGVPLR